MWAYFGWGADYPDPDDWLPSLFGTGAGNNHTLYSNPAFDALAATALKEQDNTKRLADWTKLKRWLWMTPRLSTFSTANVSIWSKQQLKA